MGRDRRAFIGMGAQTLALPRRMVCTPGFDGEPVGGDRIGRSTGISVAGAGRLKSAGVTPVERDRR